MKSFVKSLTVIGLFASCGQKSTLHISKDLNDPKKEELACLDKGLENLKEQKKIYKFVKAASKTKKGLQCLITLVFATNQDLFDYVQGRKEEKLPLTREALEEKEFFDLIFVVEEGREKAAEKAMSPDFAQTLKIAEALVKTEPTIAGSYVANFDDDGEKTLSERLWIGFMFSDEKNFIAYVEKAVKAKKNPTFAVQEKDGDSFFVPIRLEQTTLGTSK